MATAGREYTYATTGGPPALGTGQSLRTRDRKPQKPKAPPVEEPAEDEPLQRNKRSRKPPAWLGEDDYVVHTEDVPAPVGSAIQTAKQSAQGAGKKAAHGPTRMIKWQLLDKDTVVVEMEYSGKKYTGTMKRAGVSFTAGVTMQTFEAGSATGPGTNNRDLCALCNQTLLKSVMPVEDELQKVVRVSISTNWVAHVHLQCGLWAPEVYEDKHGNLVNLSGAIRRARALKCTLCKDRGAGLCCAFRGCQRVYHLTCAAELGCQLDEERFLMWCPTHSTQKKTITRKTSGP